MIKHKIQVFSKCMLCLGVLGVFVLFCMFVFVRFFHGALKHDISTLFTTFFLWTSLQFILLKKERITIFVFIKTCSRDTFSDFNHTHAPVNKLYWLNTVLNLITFIYKIEL